jgi:hypothetical protein
MLKDIQKTLILNGLRSGLGLTASCQKIGLSVKEASEEIRSDEDFANQCQTALFLGYQAKLAYAKSLLDQKNYNKWAGEVEALPNFVTDLMLWEQYCPREEVTDSKVIKAVILYSNLEEAATSMGMTRNELIEYVLDSDYLSREFQQKGYLR